MTLTELNELYQYRFDPSYDKWRILSINNFSGDCEDYALSVLYYVICNQSLSKFWKLLVFGDAKICYAENGGGHAVLQLDGMYIDNWTKDWVSRERMESLGHKFHKTDYKVYQVALKMINAKIRGLYDN